MKTYTITLKNRHEFNAVLAGLRKLQGPHSHSELDEILADGVDSPITADEIGDLCERINCTAEVT